MPKKCQDGKPLRHIISFRVSDQELKMLKRLGGRRTDKISNILRELVKNICEYDVTSAGNRLLTDQRVCRG
ncbi:MAG: hypothetical protein FIA89_08510 [Geobacter sp.]|jgi:hypothetical protein|nr:hypothetical protein [Geobacter sp.]